MSVDYHLLDATWLGYKAGKIPQADAVEEVQRNATQLTAEGAGELLASGEPPSVRWLRAQAPARNIHHAASVTMDEAPLPTEKAPRMNILERLTNAINGSYTSERHLRKVAHWEARHPARTHRKGHVPLTQQPRDQH